MKKFKRTKAFSAIFFIATLAFVLSSGCFGDNPPTPSDVDCSGSSMLTVPVNPLEVGPWPVGSQVVTIGDLKTQIWYPATPGSEVGKEKKVIDAVDMSEYIVELEGADPANYHTMDTNFYMDLPLDTVHGPYPVIIYVHGTASFRYASAKYFEHWASRGFVVLCADNPYIYLKDMRESVLNIALATQTADTEDLLAAVRSAVAPLDFLAGHVDTNRIGLSGHSAGGATVSGFSNEEGVRVIITMASGGIDDSTYLESGMVMGGIEDGTVSWDNVQSAYADMSIKKKRLLGIPDAGHMAFANVCQTVLLAPSYGIELGALISAVANDGCGPEYLDEQTTWDIVNYASTAVLEETLMCSSTAADQMDLVVDQFKGVASSDIVYRYDIQ